jgi:hypothetical protein
MKKTIEKVKLCREVFKAFAWFWGAWLILAMLYYVTWEGMQL